MPDTGRAACDQWVERVLAVRFTVQGGGGSDVNYLKSRLAWDSTRKQIQVDLQRLEAAILAETREEEFAGEVESKVKAVYSVLEILDGRLIDKLNELQTAEPGESRDRLRDEARDIIGEYADYVNDDELTLAIDDNGFIEIDLVARVTNTLQDIDAQLKSG